MFDRRFFLRAGSLAALGVLVRGTGVWNTNLHQQYETELAHWWNERGYREIRGNPCDKLLGLFQTMGGLAGLWFMNGSGGSVTDESGNGRSLAEDGAVSYAGLDCHNYVSVGAGTGLVRNDAGLAPQTAVTFGGWFRLGSVPGAFDRRVLLGIQGCFGLVVQAGSVRVEAFGDGGSGTVVGSAVLANNWCFVVGRCEIGSQTDVFVNGVKQGEAVDFGSAFVGAGYPFRLNGEGEILDMGLAHDAAFCFVAKAAVSDQLLDLIYTTSRGFFGV